MRSDFSHHVIPAANKLWHPLEMLARRETELHLNVTKQLQSLSVTIVNTVARSKIRQLVYEIEKCLAISAQTGHVLSTFQVELKRTQINRSVTARLLGAMF
jgi:hypothetical protein